MICTQFIPHILRGQFAVFIVAKKTQQHAIIMLGFLYPLILLKQVNQMNENTMIGAQEWCTLNELGIPAVVARVDSGAKTSTLHAFNINTYKTNGAFWLSFEVHPLQDNRRTTVRCHAEIIDRRPVKSSSGTIEKRYVIKHQ